MSAVLPPLDEGSFSRSREKAGDEGDRDGQSPHPSPLPQAGEGAGRALRLAHQFLTGLPVWSIPMMRSCVLG